MLTFEDVTELEAERRRGDALADAAALLAGSLDFERRSRCWRGSRCRGWPTGASSSCCATTAAIDRVAIEAADPELLERARAYVRRYPLDPDSPVGSPQVIRTGEPDLQTEIPDAMLVAAAAQDEEHLEILRGLGFRSWMIVPLRAGGRVIGDLALVSAESGPPVRRGRPRRGAGAGRPLRRSTSTTRGSTTRARARPRRARGDPRRASPTRSRCRATTAGSTYVNDAAVRLLGEPLGFNDRAALLAAPPGELAAGFEMLGEDGKPFPIDKLPGRRALAGEEPEPVIVRYRVRATGEARWSRVKARPLRAPDGSVAQAINVIEDITDLKQAEETQRLLAEAGRVLAGSLDYEETLHKVAWLAVPELADWCMVDVVGDRGLERVAVAHADPSRAGARRRAARRLDRPRRRRSGRRRSCAPGARSCTGTSTRRTTARRRSTRRTAARCCRSACARTRACR